MLIPASILLIPRGLKKLIVTIITSVLIASVEESIFCGPYYIIIADIILINSILNILSLRYL